MSLTQYTSSTSTLGIFRKGVTDAQRLAFAQNCVSFLVQYELDGLDFDWEYPGGWRFVPGIPLQASGAWPASIPQECTILVGI